MNPLLYCLIGVAGGGLLAAFVFFLTRRDSKIGPLVLGKIELLERAQEREEKVFRDELARNREENANAAKSQREELTASLESVRGSSICVYRNCKKTMRSKSNECAPR